jgi:hypothetical protein
VAGSSSRERTPWPWGGAMHCDRFSTISPGDYARAERMQKVMLAKRRRYNRLYMRSGRADPRHQAYERANRERWHYERKLRNSLRIHHPHCDDHGDPVCGFCRKGPVVTRVSRLEIRDCARRGYEEVRVPYCGEC